MTYISKLFEMGDIEGITEYDLKHFIKKRTGDKIQELGYKPEGKFKFEYDQKSIDKMAWFDHLTGGHTHTDFFAIRPTDYSKANEGEDFEDVW